MSEHLQASLMASPCNGINGRFLKSFIAIFLLSLASEVCAVNYHPWFEPPFVCEGKMAYLFEHVERVQSPKEDFSFPSLNSSLDLSVAMTPWPGWNVEAEILFTDAREITFNYEASFFTLRYAWLDDIAGDCFSLVTGATVFFPGSAFLHNFCFDYHGKVNAEFHATLGKEWALCEDWLWRTWALIGFGIADRGSPWIHGRAFLEYKFSSYLDIGLFTQAVYGLGTQNLQPELPFKGYGAIRHQSIDLGACVNYTTRYFGTVKLLGWYNVFAHNFIVHYWGLSLSVIWPFCLL